MAEILLFSEILFEGQQSPNMPLERTASLSILKQTIEKAKTNN